MRRTHPNEKVIPRLQDINAELAALMDEAWSLIHGTSEEQRAHATWLGQLMFALHDGDVTLANTIDALETECYRPRPDNDHGDHEAGTSGCQYLGGFEWSCGFGQPPIEHGERVEGQVLIEGRWICLNASAASDEPGHWVRDNHFPERQIGEEVPKLATAPGRREMVRYRVTYIDEIGNWGVVIAARVPEPTLDVNEMDESERSAR
jgi:hypothetical protein